MEYRIGQKVLCVNDSYNSYCKYPVRKGVIYTIDGFYRCICGSRQVSLAEHPEFIQMGCRCPRSGFRRQTFYEWRFIPLEYFEKFLGKSEKKVLQESK